MHSLFRSAKITHLLAFRQESVKAPIPVSVVFVPVVAAQKRNCCQLRSSMLHISISQLTTVQQVPSAPVDIQGATWCLKSLLYEVLGFGKPKAPFQIKRRLLVLIFILALSYCPRQSPAKYLRRSNVSPPSSGWVGVVPSRQKHQESFWIVNFRFQIEA